ncbi:MAG: DMT family transporter [Clostridia bacterium]|nr:DMT family transporter [Clostridia bacterium]
MAQLAGIFSGILHSLQNYLNAELSAVYGVMAGTLILHIAGLCILGPMAALGKARPLRRAPVVMHLGGLVGIANVAFASYAIPLVGVTLNLCLCLLGQLLTGAVVDQYGLLWMKKAPMNPMKALSLVFIAVGAGVMLLW